MYQNTNTVDTRDHFLRIIPPFRIKNGNMVSFRVFRPKDDDPHLSGYLESLISKKESLIHFNNFQKTNGNAKLSNCTALACLSCVFFGTSELPLNLYKSPLPDNPAHAHVDFTGFSTDEWDDMAKIMLNKSEQPIIIG